QSQRSDCVAAGDATGSGRLPCYESVSPRGNVRLDLADAARGGVDPKQHRRGQGSVLAKRIRPISPERSRLALRTGDANRDRASIVVSRGRRRDVINSSFVGG